MSPDEKDVLNLVASVLHAETSPRGERVLRRVYERVTTEGAAEYGRLDIDADVRDFVGETADELADALFYAAIAFRLSDVPIGFLHNLANVAMWLQQIRDEGR